MPPAALVLISHINTDVLDILWIVDRVEKSPKRSGSGVYPIDRIRGDAYEEETGLYDHSSNVRRF